MYADSSSTIEERAQPRREYFNVSEKFDEAERDWGARGATWAPLPTGRESDGDTDQGAQLVDSEDGDGLSDTSGGSSSEPTSESRMSGSRERGTTRSPAQAVEEEVFDSDVGEE